MNEIKRSIYYIFLFCTFIGCLFFIKIDCYADNNASVNYERINQVGHSYMNATTYWSYPDSRRFCLYVTNSNVENISYQAFLYSNDHTPFNYTNYIYLYDLEDVLISQDQTNGRYFVDYSNVAEGVYRDGLSSATFYTMNDFDATIPIFYDSESAIRYIQEGIISNNNFDDSLMLDDFKVTSWSIGTSQLAFNSKFIATWSDPRISVVQVIVQGTNGRDSFEGNVSPFKGNFKASNYVINNGDTVKLIATPYDRIGTVGRSLYYTFTYNDHIPFSYIYRKLFKTRDYDNTVEIPYNPPGGDPTSLTLPVDGITENKKYEIKYNPTTNEIENIYNFDLDYNIIINYPEDLSSNDVINNTQEYVTNNFITNNYYNTEKNVNVDFDFDFGDVSTNDATDFKNDFDSWFDGLGGFIGKLAKFLIGLAPWLSPSVAVWIVAGFGFIVLLLTLLVVIKIVSFIRSLLPF